MTDILKKTIILFIYAHLYALCYNNFNELKTDMEAKVSNLSIILQNIYNQKCGNNTFKCPIKSFNICDGTDQRTCIDTFPTSTDCHGTSKYSMTSGIRIPNSVASFNLSEEIKFFICKTAEPRVQNYLKELIRKNQSAWVSLASNLGVIRISPGFKYEKQNDTATCKNYDPRLRPWYSQNTYGRKKMIILIQNSKGIYDQPNRFTSMQMSLSAILKTSQNGDLFNVIQFSDSPRLFYSQKEQKLVSLNEQIRKYQKSKNYQGDFYQSIAQNITKSESIEANYKKALQLALKVFQNSHSTNPETENLILFFAGFKPTNLTTDYHIELSSILAESQNSQSTNYLFFGFGVDLHDEDGIKILNYLTCQFDGIYIELSSVTYDSIFLDQAKSYYDYLTQGNEVKDPQWTDIYEDAFGMGKMVSVIKTSYYQQFNVTKLIGVVILDVPLKQLIVYMSLEQMRQKLQTTKLPFKKNISQCTLETLRKRFRCKKPQISKCKIFQQCVSLISPINETVIRPPVDVSNDICCFENLQSTTGMIIGIVLGGIGAICLIALMIYCKIFRKKNKNELQKTYAEIFQKFKDFDRTRIRSDSEISIIKQ